MERASVIWSDRWTVTKTQKCEPQSAIRRERFIPFAMIVIAGCTIAMFGIIACGASKAAATILAESSADWRSPDPNNTLYLDLPIGRVVIELAPSFAPRAVANVKSLVRDRYFDGLAVIRVQDNYVVQWGDPDDTRSLGKVASRLAPEFTVALTRKLSFAPLLDRDGYAPETGFSDGLPAARDAKTGRAWLVHCYGMVGVARDSAADSGNGSSLYVVIGPARMLDRNVTLVGRVVQGMELLSALPRGTGHLGFYEKPEQRLPIKAMRVAIDVPEGERTKLEILRTDTQTFAALVDERRNRRDDLTKIPAGHVDVCSITAPTRSPP